MTWSEFQGSHLSSRGLMHIGRKESCVSEDCQPAPRPSTDELLGIAPDWTDGKPVDEYLREQRRR